MNKYEQIKGMANQNRGSVGVQEAQSPQRTWVGLTDEERKELWAEGHSDYAIDAIEAKLKEKNT